MSFITTAAGHELSLLYPKPAHFHPPTIAHQLAQINRYSGACMRPYSVAEHSLLVCEIAERELRLDVHGRLAALLHDAHEFAVGDCTSPVKELLGPEWARLEARIATATRSAFAIHGAMATHATAVRTADLRALATERRDLLHPAARTPWPVLQGIQPVSWVSLNTPERAAMTWQEWARCFTDKLDELEYERNQRLFAVAQP